jgi:hypothetical protein
MVFLLMAIAIMKNGIAAAIQLWGVMGALTGVAFGGITTYYFTNQANQGAIAQARIEKDNAVQAKDTALASLSDVRASATKARDVLASVSSGQKHGNVEVEKLTAVSEQLAEIQGTSKAAGGESTRVPGLPRADQAPADAAAVGSAEPPPPKQ